MILDHKGVCLMFRFSWFVSLALVLLLGLVADARAGIMTPAGLNPGDQFRIVFVTDGLITATSGNHSTYDNFVSSEANMAGLLTYNGSPVTWQAIVSVTDGTVASAAGRLPTDGVPIFLNNGTTEVAASGAALWNTATTPLQSSIHLDAAGGTPSGTTTIVWTGTEVNGSSFFPLGPASATDASATGSYPATDLGLWVNAGPQPAGDSERLYGYSSILTVPSPVPEPGVLTLALVGIGGLVGARLARRRRAAAPGPSGYTPGHS
jgi:hypothetical protein